MNDNKPLISIIVPAYNAASSLERCLNSILNQSFSDFELLVVNDGSTDTTHSILLNYRAVFGSKLKIFNQPNSGVSVSRNFAVHEASGDYITFVDADDWLEIDFLDSLIKKSGFDFIIGGFNSVSKLSSSSNLKEVDVTSFVNLDEIFKDLETQFIFNPPWGKLFKRKIIVENNILFDPEYSYGEDKLFNLRFLRNINNFSVVSSLGYNYVIHQSGLSQREYSYEIIKKWHSELLDNYILTCEYFSLKEDTNRFFQERSNSFFCYYKLDLLFSRKNNLNVTYIKSELSNIYSLNFAKGASSASAISKKQKVSFILYRLGIPTVTFMVYWVMRRLLNVRLL